MTDKAELHPVTVLLLARMESHPEEFHERYAGRWAGLIQEVMEVAPSADCETLKATYNKLRLDKLYNDVMDEMLNGEERRARNMQLEKAELYSTPRTVSAWDDPIVGIGAYPYHPRINQPLTTTLEDVAEMLPGYKGLTGGK